MFKKLFVLYVFTLLTVLSVAQTIRITGSVLSLVDNKPIPQASVVLYQVVNVESRSIISYAISNSQGKFIINTILSDTCIYLLSTSHIGFEKEDQKLSFIKSDTVISIDFFLTPSKNQLSEIIIENKQPVRIKKDTVEFTADSFRTVQTRKVEDLIRNIEGFRVESDGRITYRGKEVKALLLDGDDLTQDQYQLLTRNLNADMVDKLQVIDNYNKNRIMGGLLESNQAAINLKLKKGMQGKLNGSVSAAGSVEGRYEGDATLVWLKSRFKMVYLANANNIAKDATGLLHYQESGNASFLQQRDDLSKKIVNGLGLVNAGTVTSPDIAKEYMLDNKNFFTSPLLHFRINKSVKLAARIYAVEDALFFKGQRSSETFIDEQTKWNVQNVLASEKKRQNIAGNIELSHDNLKRFAGGLNAQWGWANAKDFYRNETSGFFSDTLNERVNANRIGYAGAYMGALKLSEFNVLNLQSSFSVIPERQRFNTNTDRLQLFYGIDNRYQLFAQATNGTVSNQQNSISFLHKKGKVTYRLGYETNWQKLAMLNSVVSEDSVLSISDNSVSFFENRLSFLTVYQLSGKSSVKFLLNSGIGSGKNTMHGKDQFFLWRANAEYVYKLKVFSGLRLSLLSARELPSIMYFHSQNMITANASVISGATRILPQEYYTAALSFSNFKIVSKFSLLAGINIRYGKTDYTGNSILQPQYTLREWGLVTNNRQAGVNFDIGSFVFPLNSTFRLSSNANFSINNQLLNSKEVENRVFFGRFTLTWVPSFKIPVSWQVDFSKDFFENRQFNESQTLFNKNNTTDVLVKLRTAFKGNYYIGTQYNYLSLTENQEFHLLGIFQNLTLTKKLNVDLVAHNLLNNKHFVQRVNSPNTRSENTFIGVGRYFLLRVNYSF